MTAAAILSKRVPTGDESLAARQDAYDARAARYPEIESTDNRRLSAGPDDPIDEDLWGDPVNLIFPLAYRDGSLDPERARRARGRFKQFGSGIYDSNRSLAAVHARIVEAMVVAGMEPAYDLDDPLDRLLPREVVDMITKSAHDYRAKIATLLKRVKPESTTGSGVSFDTVIAALNDMAVRGASGPALSSLAKDVAALKKNFEGTLEPPDAVAPRLEFGEPPADPRVVVDSEDEKLGVVDPASPSEQMSTNGIDTNPTRPGPHGDTRAPGRFQIPPEVRPSGSDFVPDGVAKSTGHRPRNGYDSEYGVEG